VAGGTAGPVRRVRGPETDGGLAGCPPAGPSLRKSRTHVTPMSFARDRRPVAPLMPGYPAELVGLRR